MLTYTTNLLHKLQIHSKVPFFTALTYFGTSVPSSGNSCNEFKTCWFITDNNNSAH